MVLPADLHEAVDNDRLFDLEAAEAAALVLDLLAVELESEDAQVRDATVVDCLSSHPESLSILESVPLDRIRDLAIRIIELLGNNPPQSAIASAWRLLDVTRHREMRRRVSAEGATSEWADLVTSLVDGAHFTFPRLFKQRADRHPSRVLFVVPGHAGPRRVTWRQVQGRVDLLARGLLALTSGDDPGTTTAILSENRLDMVLVDLACLTSGIVNIMIPATATEADVEYILKHSNVGTVAVSGQTRLHMILNLRDRCPLVQRVIAIDGGMKPRRGVLPLQAVLERAGETTVADLKARRDAIRISDRATVMYTSGTTGVPKGICFSHRNIVTKRFHRALALPEIGEGDCFLSYLPLFHTFGRFLEMTGSIFWGATYVFAENPAVETLMSQMEQHQPTIFISIPMKWMQLYEAIGAEVPLETADETAIREAVRRATGGRLKWGLSAAGYLDPDIFRFFQRNGIELMSGFGMTEATGGITMTPPGGYRDDSLGPALPGIELRLGEDGELLVRGPYVMEGYLDPPDGAESFDADGWFHTGDLMEMSEDGFITIIDRKKEIYKNVKGQTIAPQKIENLFRDFDSIGRIFLVGDHRPYNTALIQPNLDFPDADLRSFSRDDLKEHYRSIIVTANTFLAPFERIVDFAVTERDFSAEHGELTPKNTFRRKIVERNFADAIRQLYQRATITVGGVNLIFPNWLIQALGVTAQDLNVSAGRLLLAGTTTELEVLDLDDAAVQVGPVAYWREDDRPLNIGSLLSAPRLWLGNEQLVDFVQLEPDQREYKSRRRLSIGWARRVTPYVPSDEDRSLVEDLIRSHEPEMLGLHHAALILESASTDDGALAVRALEHVLDTSNGELAIEARRVLRRAAAHREPAVVRRAFQVLATAEPGREYRAMLASFLAALPDLLDSETTGVLVDRSLTPDQLESVFAETDRLWRHAEATTDETTSATGLLRFLAEYGANHPASYRPIRAFMTRVALTAADEAIRGVARTELDTLRLGFRTWLGSQPRIAVDTETGFEYHWEDVVAFADDVDREATDRIMAALRSTPMLREGIFLFSGGASVSLSDILPGGVWIRLLGEDHGKSVYRIAVKTRNKDQFDLALNLNRDLDQHHVEEEIDWLVVCSAGGDKGPLAEEFGGWWPDHGLWTEEFIGGDTLDHALKRLARRTPDEDRLIAVWPHAAWSALAAYVDFWDRTGRRYEIADPTPNNVVVPMHDYHTDARLVSITARKSFGSIAGMLNSFWKHFIRPVEEAHPNLSGLVTWDIPCAALLEIIGETDGVELLESALVESKSIEAAGAPKQIKAFVKSVRDGGFIPRRLYFAAKRYRRWARLNPDATTLARASTLGEIDSTYGLSSLQKFYPEVRTRFFRETVFRDGPPSLLSGLATLITSLRTGELLQDELSDAIADLRAHLTLDHDDDYFLARLSYPYLQPEDEAEYVAATTAGSQQSEMVVTVEDSEGEVYRIRHALSPKEVGRLHRLFLAANLQVQFRPEHRFLVAVNDRGHLMGGLFYEISPEARTAHMDKIVVGESYRGRGVAGHLLEELCNRMKTGGLVSVTTGFFRPQFFYRYGFTVEKRYAGLVRRLTGDEEQI